jgi:hypothetical protein
MGIILRLSCRGPDFGHRCQYAGWATTSGMVGSVCCLSARWTDQGLKGLLRRQSWWEGPRLADLAHMHQSPDELKALFTPRSNRYEHGTALPANGLKQRGGASWRAGGNARAGRSNSWRSGNPMRAVHGMDVRPTACPAEMPMTLLAGIFEADMLASEQAGRLVVELLADLPKSWHSSRQCGPRRCASAREYSTRWRRRSSGNSSRPWPGLLARSAGVSAAPWPVSTAGVSAA